MVNPEILDYVKKELAKGISESALRNILIEHSWPEAEIHEAFEKAKEAKLAENKPVEKPAEEIHKEEPEETKPEKAVKAIETVKNIITNKFLIIGFIIITLVIISYVLLPTIFEEKERVEGFSEAARDYAEDICTQYCNTNLCGLVNDPEFTHPEIEGKSCKDVGFPCLQSNGEPKCETEY